MSQKLSNWASIAEIISGVAVVITLVFLVIGIRDNTAVTRAAMYQSSIGQIIDFRYQVLNDREVAKLFRAFMNGEQLELDAIDATRQNQLILNAFQIYEQAYFAKESNLLGAAEWRRFERVICQFSARIATSPSWLRSVEELMTEEFMGFVAATCGP